jgi:hypothetical protein
MAGSNQVLSVLNKTLGTTLDYTLRGAVLATDRLSQAISKLMNNAPLSNQVSLYAFSDMVTTTSDTRYFIYTTNNGATSALAFNTSIEPNAVFGIIRLSLGSSTTVNANVSISSTLTFLIEAVMQSITNYEFNYRLSLFTVPYNASSALHENIIGLTNTILVQPTDGVFIRYNGGLSPNYVCVCISNNISTIIDTGIQVTANSNINKFSITIETLSGVITCKFYMNGAIIGTITSNIPTGKLLRHAVFCRKTSSINSNSSGGGVLIDYVEIKGKYSR